MVGYGSDRPYGWPTGTADRRRHDGGDAMNEVRGILAYDLIDRRMGEASEHRLAVLAARNRTRDGFVVRFRARIGGAITSLGHALAGDAARVAARPLTRVAAPPAGGCATQPGC